MMNQKTLKRNTQDRIVGGVCSGLARYFDIEPWIARLVCVLLLLAAPPQMVLLYIILWVVIPADTVPEFTGMEMTDDLGPVPSDLDEKNKGNLFLGILLIGLGLLFLLRNYILWFDWGTIWPIVLIILGIGILLSGKSKDMDADEANIIIDTNNKSEKENPSEDESSHQEN